MACLGPEPLEAPAVAGAAVFLPPHAKAEVELIATQAIAIPSKYVSFFNIKVLHKICCTIYCRLQSVSNPLIFTH